MFRLSMVVRGLIAALFVAVVMAVIAAAQSEKSVGAVSPTPETEKAEREKKLAVAADVAKQLLLVMDTDKSGRVSKQEWMKFMEEEFERLDTDHKGQLDVKELTKSRVRMGPYVGK
jgi:Ca2+-binding EF-hand superfamily protein